MSLFFETIQIFNSVPLNIDLHSERMNRARFDILGLNNELNIRDYLELPSDMELCNKVKCRVLYSKEIDDIQYRAYSAKAASKIMLVECNDISYSYKYLNRKLLEELREGFDDSVEILIVKNSLITDTSIHNIALYNGNEWHTPAKPLLCGVQREYLLRKGIIIPRDLHKNCLKDYSKIRMFNAMNGWEESTELSTDCIV